MYRKILKRLMDLLLALILSMPALPVLLIAVLWVRLNSYGPVFFVQQRPGMSGRIFKIYKLRTMTSERDSEGNLLPDIERITRTGRLLRKLSIDELPQLLNIIKGQMSFIGPRPLLVQYLEHYTPEQMRRHEVLPGITGWAQVNGRNTISWEEKFQLDVWYVDNMSLLLDIKIALKTIRNIIARKDVNSSESDTMPLFTGSRNQMPL